MDPLARLFAAWAAALAPEAPPAPSALERAWAAALSDPAPDLFRDGTTRRTVPVPMPAAIAGDDAPPPVAWLATFERGPDGLVASVLVHCDDPARPAWMLTPERDARGQVQAAKIEPLPGGPHV